MASPHFGTLPVQQVRISSGTTTRSTVFLVPLSSIEKISSSEQLNSSGLQSTRMLVELANVISTPLAVIENCVIFRPQQAKSFLTSTNESMSQTSIIIVCLPLPPVYFTKNSFPILRDHSDPLSPNPDKSTYVWEKLTFMSSLPVILIILSTLGYSILFMQESFTLRPGSFGYTPEWVMNVNGSIPATLACVNVQSRPISTIYNVVPVGIVTDRSGTWQTRRT